MSLLEINKVKKIYTHRRFFYKDEIIAVNNLSLSIGEGKCVALVGESGCGKSTLGRLVVGLDEPTNGSLIFKGNKINSKNNKQSSWRKDIQIVFQESFNAVNHRYNAMEIIKEPIENFYDLSSKDMEEKIDELIEMVGINKSEKLKYPKQFSGGQLQRICIARALASNPSLIVLDEPLSSLDVSVQAQILNLLRDLKKELNLSYLLISHDLEAVYYLADSIAVMYGGRIMEYIDDIVDFQNLTHPYTKKLVSSSSDYLDDEQYDIEEIIDRNSNNNLAGCPYASRCEQALDKCTYEIPKTKFLSKTHKIACHIF